MTTTNNELQNHVNSLADRIESYNYGGGFISRNDSKAEIYIYID